MSLLDNNVRIEIDLYLCKLVHHRKDPISDILALILICNYRFTQIYIIEQTQEAVSALDTYSLEIYLYDLIVSTDLSK